MESNAQIIAWENEQSNMKLLVSEGAQNYFSKEFPDLKHSFLPDTHCVVCIDEGMAHKDMSGESKFCMAGSGILFPATNEAERLQKVAELFLKNGVIAVTSHNGCGFAGIAYHRDFPEAKPGEIKVEIIEEYAKDWVKKLKDEMGRQGKDPELTHIVAEDMERPVEFHIARLAYYDAVGGFNPNKEIGLPMGFVIERKSLSAEYTSMELLLTVSIAFGNHGFGELFTKENPFVVVVWANTEEELNMVKEEIKSTLANNEPYKRERIKIDGIVILK